MLRLARLCRAVGKQVDSERGVATQRRPYKLELKPGTDYYYCACGLSARQPFCDGSHKKEGLFEPVKFRIEEAKAYGVCGCRQNETGVFCDGSHKRVDW
jgi:CDGSH-type Zn-finger protein